MADNELKGVIMAAGKGTRMAPFNLAIPKPLLPICNIPLIEYHINYMKELGIHEIIIVVGHLSFEIARQMGDGSSLDVKIKYVEQKENLGIAHAVGKLEPFISGRFLLFLGDIFFEPNQFQKMVEIMDETASSAVLAVVDENDSEAIKRNFAVILGTDGYVKRVIEKPRYVLNKIKGCGIYLFDPHIFDAIRRTPRTALRDEYELTDAIQILIEYGFFVNIAHVIKEDINLSYPHDLLKCNIDRLRIMSQDVVLGENIQINDSLVTNSVIGNNVMIRYPITITNSLIFSGSKIISKADLNYAIVTPDQVIECKGFFIA